MLGLLEVHGLSETFYQEPFVYVWLVSGSSALGAICCVDHTRVSSSTYQAPDLCPAQADQHVAI